MQRPATPRRETYEEEQQRYQRKRGREPTPEDPNDPNRAEEDASQQPLPQLPEVNPAVYRDVGPLIFRGFLTQEAEINGVQFVFKNLNQHEFELVQWLGGSAEKSSSRFWSTFIAYSVFVVHGTNVLADREKWLESLARMANEIPLAARDKVVRYLSELNRRASSATILVEAYGMEAGSRFRWAQVRGLDLTSSSVTGIAGTQGLGHNWGQLLWRAVNHFEDQNQVLEREWENAKFVGSCFAGKGIQRVYNQDINRRRQEMEDKITRRDKVLRHVFEGLDLEDGKVLRDGRVVMGPRTLQELTDQMQRDMKGERDWHDQVVDSIENQIRQKVAQRQQSMAELAAEHEKTFGDKPVLGGTILHGLSPQEAKERAKRARQVAAQNLQRVLQVPSLNEKHQEHLYKWGLAADNYQNPVRPEEQQADPPQPPPPEAGSTVRNGVPVVPAQSPVNTRPVGTPFRR